MSRQWWPTVMLLDTTSSRPAVAWPQGSLPPPRSCSSRPRPWRHRPVPPPPRSAHGQGWVQSHPRPARASRRRGRPGTVRRGPAHRPVVPGPADLGGQTGHGGGRPAAVTSTPTACPTSDAAVAGWPATNASGPIDSTPSIRPPAGCRWCWSGRGTTRTPPPVGTGLRPVG